MAEWQESFLAFQECLGQPSIQRRLPAALKAGLQSDVDFEKNLAHEMLRFVGDGPFHV